MLPKVRRRDPRVRPARCNFDQTLVSRQVIEIDQAFDVATVERIREREGAHARTGAVLVHQDAVVLEALDQSPDRRADLAEEICVSRRLIEIDQPEQVVVVLEETNAAVLREEAAPEKRACAFCLLERDVEAPELDEKSGEVSKVGNEWGGIDAIATPVRRREHAIVPAPACHEVFEVVVEALGRPRAFESGGSHDAINSLRPSCQGGVSCGPASLCACEEVGLSFVDEPQNRRRFLPLALHGGAHFWDQTLEKVPNVVVVALIQDAPEEAQTRVHVLEPDRDELRDEHFLVLRAAHVLGSNASSSKSFSPGRIR